MKSIKIEDVIIPSKNFPKTQYQYLLDIVLNVLKEKKDFNIIEIIKELYNKSNVEDRLKKFFLVRKIAPGAVVSISTQYINQVISIGNQQEVEMCDGNLVPKIVEMNIEGIFDLASITKIFTSISILQLVSKNKLSLSDKIGSIVPQFHNLVELTIEDLLKFAMIKTDRCLENANSYEETEQILFDSKHVLQTDIEDTYNDIAPIILKYIIERISNVSFYDYIKINILDPLNMNSTFVNPKENSAIEHLIVNENYSMSLGTKGIKLKNIEKGISTDSKAVILGQPEGLLSGHAGLFSTVKDLDKLGKGLIDGKILDKKFVNLLSIKQVGKTFVNSNGVDWATQYFSYLVYVKNPIEKRNVVYYGLSDNSFAGAGWTGTKFVVDIDNKIVFSLLSNRVHNRLVNIDLNARNKICDFEDGTKGIILDNGKRIIDSSMFAHERDEAVINSLLDLSIMYRMLENILILNNSVKIEYKNLQTRVK